jgi:hypothetical protein
MIEIYVKLIKAGKRTIEQVPEHIREQVREALMEDNYVVEIKPKEIKSEEDAEK